MKKLNTAILFFIVLILVVPVTLFASNTGSTTSWPTKAMIGYIDTTATGSMSAITQEQLDSYNVIIFGFANSDGTISSEMQSSIDNIESKEKSGTINLISIGGQFGGSFSLTQNSINNLVQTVSNNNLDGVDSDIEGTPLQTADINTFAMNLKDELGGDKFVTVAPILAGTADAPTLNMPMGAAFDFSNTDYTAILVQAYNSGTSFTYHDPINDGALVDESNKDIVAAAYDSLNKYGNINKDQKLVIGMGTNSGGCDTASCIWNVSDQQAIDAVTSSIKSNVSSIENNDYGIDGSQFGGLMGWSLNSDAMPSAYTPYSGCINADPGYFAQNVASYISSENNLKSI